MHSLLTEEIKKYNKNKNNLEKNNENIFFEKIFINIKEEENKLEKNIIDNMKINNKEYIINMNSFNPMKNSPPNNWNCRLLSRINSLNNLKN